MHRASWKVLFIYTPIDTPDEAELFKKCVKWAFNIRSLLKV
jgi:hypothetical protein